VTHVLLPVVVLLRRADLAVVIAAALAAKAAGAGYRPIAAALGRPVETVRGWLGRFGGRLEPVRALFTVWLRVLDPPPRLLRRGMRGRMPWLRWRRQPLRWHAGSLHGAVGTVTNGLFVWPQVMVNGIPGGDFLAPCNRRSVLATTQMTVRDLYFGRAGVHDGREQVGL
jgi:hypothetical protein